MYAVSQIAKIRANSDTEEGRSGIKNAYIIRQFKRTEEIDMLRGLYGPLFFQVSLYSRRNARVDSLANRFSHDRPSSVSTDHRADAEDLVNRDEHERQDEYGQRVSDTFHDADFIVNLDGSPTVQDQVERLVQLVFGANYISPSRQEYGLFLAKAAALRSLDLSRQVGAALFSESGTVLTMGSNEVPQAGGGTYWSDDEFDARDYKRGYDSNSRRKSEMATDILVRLDGVAQSERRAKLEKAVFMSALEYGRVVHAEMVAITDAARLGVSLGGSTLYTTTFPCHMCAKHIIAAGVRRVVFLEPYPKSLTDDLHPDAVRIEGGGRGKYEAFPAVVFQHFFGVTHRRYRELFERQSRKDGSGEFQEYETFRDRPLRALVKDADLYLPVEKAVIARLRSAIADASLDVL